MLQMEPTKRTGVAVGLVDVFDCHDRSVFFGVEGVVAIPDPIENVVSGRGRTIMAWD